MNELFPSQINYGWLDRKSMSETKSPIKVDIFFVGVLRTLKGIFIIYWRYFKRIISDPLIGLKKR
jgi:hypothetical protein